MRTHRQITANHCNFQAEDLLTTAAISLLNLAQVPVSQHSLIYLIQVIDRLLTVQAQATIV